ncbi:MAG: PIN domain protein [Kiritimatiellae bacterium]|nr:PIN domain protein [Kiritimatiellia bacterium]
MRIYLDNCCYNRPYDEQGQLRIRLETEAKLRIQHLMRIGVVEYAWSDILTHEVSFNPIKRRRQLIFDWRMNAIVDIAAEWDVVLRGKEFQSLGLKPKDALHLASALKAECDWFITTDTGILKKVGNIERMRVGNPIDFVMTEEDGALWK